jgi:ammonia channel protein AmtB
MGARGTRLQISKQRFGIDDALDVHWIHGATGSLGSVLLGVFGRRAGDGVIDYYLHFHSTPWFVFIQIVGVTVVGVYSFACSWAILAMMQVLPSLQPNTAWPCAPTRADPGLGRRGWGR